MPAPKEEQFLPSDALMVTQVLESMGIKEYEPTVVHQLLEFMYRNVAEVLQVAEAFQERAGLSQKGIGLEDVMLAIQAKAITSFVTPPSQDTLQALADRRNKMALPALDKQKFGFRLPPPEDCLIAPNFQFHPRNAPEAMDWEDDPIPTGAGTEPVNGPPTRHLKSDTQRKATHEAFQDTEVAGSDTLAAGAARDSSHTAVEHGATEMQS